MPAACAPWSTANRWRNRSSGPLAGSPPVTHSVRVMSESVAVDRAADVEHDRLAGGDDPLGRLVVGRGGVRPGPDDREMRLVVALGDESLADLAGDVRLGPPDQPAGGDLGDDAIGGVGRLGQQRDLVVVLDDPEAAQDRRGELEAWPRRVAPGGAGDAAPGGRRRRRSGADPVRAPSRTIDATSACASSASSQVTTGSRPAAAGGHDRAGVASRRGTTRAQSPAAGMTSIVRRSSGMAG